MSTPTRVAAFITALAAAFALAWGGGRLVGPIEAAPAPVAHEGGTGGHDDETGDETSGEAGGEDAGHGAHDATEAVADATGLTARADGFTLALADREVRAGRTRLDFRVLTSSGRPLLDYTREHEKDLHLIVVRRDLTGFQHVHPRLDRATGTWSVDVRLTPGVWRVVADFTPAGWDGLTLADDVAVAGDFAPTPMPTDDRTARVRTEAGTYTVTLEGDTAPGSATTLTTRVELDGAPVTDLQPYLGAFGHLVALRAGDLGYLHVHPEAGEPGPGIEFATAFPTHGTYRLFLDFRHRGAVHTAAFTVDAGGVPGGDSTDGVGDDAHEQGEEGEGHDH
ncbi:hypothetical protein SFC79_05845 [Nocardioides sp. S-58]|uniref:Heavy-metal-associated domain-containing protein n=1 Tax=Nocardioides renjunii TaxID=3095075 RepID=A0ABU5K8W8_9ACTN|nr:MULTISPECIES: hypothetical protein [unclassified Nocardioides]MDZ5661283.1 hypothetical protein [Nocardioides sp. S-58]WQQ22286.1 hypothetical protein SHK17_20645 [Nocardioides sp. S-34]